MTNSRSAYLDRTDYQSLRKPACFKTVLNAEGTTWTTPLESSGVSGHRQWKQTLHFSKHIRKSAGGACLRMPKTPYPFMTYGNLSCNSLAVLIPSEKLLNILWLPLSSMLALYKNNMTPFVTAMAQRNASVNCKKYVADMPASFPLCICQWQLCRVSLESRHFTVCRNVLLRLTDNWLRRLRFWPPSRICHTGVSALVIGF